MELGRERRRGRADRREGEGASRERGGAEGERWGPCSSSSASRHRADGVRLPQPASCKQMLRAGAASREQFLPTGIDNLVLSACEGYQRRDAQALRCGVASEELCYLFSFAGGSILVLYSSKRSMVQS